MKSASAREIRFPGDEEPRMLKLGRWRVYAQFYQQWKDFFVNSYNWRNFTFIDFSIEWSDSRAHYKGRYLEVTIALLGFTLVTEIYDAVDRAGELTHVTRMIQDYEEKEGKDTYDV